jgi:hypothetical protein
MPSSDLLRNAIVRATKELWQADAAGDVTGGIAWSLELTALIREYRQSLDTQPPPG